jgi:hypothetical protein
MPGLDPGIHRTSKNVLTTLMDCRVKPGNDEVNGLRHVGAALATAQRRL